MKTMEKFTPKTPYPAQEYRRYKEMFIEELWELINSAASENTVYILEKRAKKEIEQLEELDSEAYWLAIADGYVCNDSTKLCDTDEKSLGFVKKMVDNPKRLYKDIYVGFSMEYSLGKYSGQANPKEM